MASLKLANGKHIEVDAEELLNLIRQETLKAAKTVQETEDTTAQLLQKLQRKVDCDIHDIQSSAGNVPPHKLELLRCAARLYLNIN